MRLYDTGREAVVALAPSRRGVLRLHAVGPTVDGPADIGCMRTLLLTDLIRRGAALGGLTVRLVQDVTDGASLDHLSTMNIYPAEGYRRPGESLDLGGAANVIILDSSDAQPPRDCAAAVVRGGPTLFDGLDTCTTVGYVPLVSDLAARGLDPLALRLCLFSSHYRQPIDVDWAALEAAHATLVRWRRRVAAWATEPSVAMPAGAVTTLRAAVDDDLDVPAVLHALEALEESVDVAPGAKFETFAYIDRVLGLDLVRHVGR